MSFDVLPAVDLRGGQVADRSAPRGVTDPVRLIERYREQGATWIHLADLDRAFGVGDHHVLIGELLAHFEDMRFQLSGGIVTGEDVLFGLHSGAARVNLSAASLADMTEVAAAVALDPDRVAVCLDIRDADVCPRGGQGYVMPWRDAAEELCDLGCQTLIVTDVDRDGAMTGPALNLFKDVASVFGHPVIASGGVGRLDDCFAIAGAVPWVRGLVLGRALACEKFTLAQALAAFPRS